MGPAFKVDVVTRFECRHILTCSIWVWPNIPTTIRLPLPFPLHAVGCSMHMYVFLECLGLGGSMWVIPWIHVGKAALLAGTQREPF